MTTEIILTRQYNQSIEQVWFALTNKEALAAWFSPHDLKEDLDKLPTGEVFHFISKSNPFWDGKMICRLVEATTPYKLRYEFGGAWMKTPTIVEWTLESRDGGTYLTLSHTGFVGIRGWLLSKMLKSGWNSMMNSQAFSDSMK
ncbi:SRPBCC family protein [Mangrovibacillus cuniculi]|uniref:SRPBCC domain-containing protein n=1 Tax=Mangrovibacillus cuniculi TaxID=2593652 RepID=A0A7S8C964_9BACI|nr:SRPBCC domain-containing protein [Mangrovibacillus cuniculi]QPC45596.1 SRPBCC domain-containing protein [Mangrovibacillus cuniculi]